MEKRQLLVGIDLGIWKNTGVALYDPKKKIYIYIKSTDLFEAMDICKGLNLVENLEIVVVVENANMDSNVFGADQNFMTYLRSWLGRKPFDFKAILKQIRMVITWGGNVGKNKGAAITFCAKLRELNIPMVEIAPSTRRVAGSSIKIGQLEQEIPLNQLPMPTKVKSPAFIKLTGHKGETNEHGRDAATLLWKKSFIYYKNFARTQTINIQAKKEAEAKKRALKRKNKKK